MQVIEPNAIIFTKEFLKMFKFSREAGRKIIPQIGFTKVTNRRYLIGSDILEFFKKNRVRFD